MVKVFRRKVEGKKTVEMQWLECGEIRGGNSRSTMRKKLSKTEEIGKVRRLIIW